MSNPARQDDVMVVGCGSAVSGSRCAEIRETLRQAVAAGTTRVAFDLQETTELSPSGVYLVLSARKTLAARGGEVTLRNLGAEVREVLTVLGLAQRLGVAEP